jgi:hypothetical protein
MGGSHVASIGSAEREREKEPGLDASGAVVMVENQILPEVGAMIQMTVILSLSRIPLFILNRMTPQN